MLHPVSGRRRWLIFLIWALAFATIPIWTHFEPPFWDVAVYVNAIHSLRLHHDPYADAIAVQRVFHSTLALHPRAVPPYSYVYSPLTLPALALIGSLPFWLSGALYGLTYIAGSLAQVFVGLDAAETSERRLFAFLAPAALFFPALLQNNTILSGNVAYILYGAILAAALLGWRRNSWLTFYLVTLAASCLKAPLLSVLVIPVLSARRQWLSAGVTAVAGLGLFAIQPSIWPNLFRHYLEAVELQFSFNHDFGCSPASLLSDYLWDHNLPYSPANILFYLAYALPLLGVLFYLSRRFLRGDFTLKQWIPVLLIGVILLNPRVKEYDVAPLTLPIGLILWRFFTVLTRASGKVRWTGLCFAGFFIGTNALACSPLENIWLLTAAPQIVFCFVIGSWTLLHHAARRQVAESASHSSAWAALRSSPQP